MRKLLTLSIALVTVVSISVRASDAGWTPNAKDVGELESIMDLSVAERLGAPPPESLAKYARVYAGVTVRGHRMIRGVLLLATSTGMSIVPEKHLPGIMDGGCGIINLLYDPQTAQIVWIRCNGLA